jgi:methyl-accepting chemotaxis protein
VSLKNEILFLSSTNKRLANMIAGKLERLLSQSVRLDGKLEQVLREAGELGNGLNRSIEEIERAKRAAEQAKERAVEAGKQAGEAAQKAREGVSKTIEVLTKQRSLGQGLDKVLGAVNAALLKLGAIASIVGAIFSILNFIRFGDIELAIKNLSSKIDSNNTLISKLSFRIRDLLDEKFRSITHWLLNIRESTYNLARGIENVNVNIGTVGNSVTETFRETVRQGVTTRQEVADTRSSIISTIQRENDSLRKSIRDAANSVNTTVEKARTDINQFSFNNPRLGQILAGIGGITAASLGILSLRDLIRNNATGSSQVVSTCRFAPDPFTPVINTAMTATVVPNVIQANQKASTILTRLGTQLQGGISGFLHRFANSTLVTQTLSAANTLMLLHNAYWLSNSLTETLFQAIGNSLAAFGIKDIDGRPYDVSAWVGQKFEAMAKSLLGVSNVNGIKQGWAKYSRIYQAAANIVWSIQSIMYSIQDVLEVVGEWIARIGNALRKDGVVRENAFGWMNESLVQNRPGPLGGLQRVLDGLEEAEDVVSQVDQVASEVLSIQETLTELEKQREEFRTALEEAMPQPGIENLPIKEQFETGKADSQSSDIPRDATNRASQD